MKNILFIGLASFAMFLFCGPSDPKENNVAVQSKDTKLPDWQWTSGEVEMKKTASKQSFTITFAPQFYHPRDSVKITFTSYQISLTNLDNAAAFSNWSGRVNLVYYINRNWVPIVADTNDVINQPFTGTKAKLNNELKKYTVLFTVPLSRILTITTSAVLLQLDNAEVSPLLSNGKSVPTLTTSISGIEVQKIERTNQ